MAQSLVTIDASAPIDKIIKIIEQDGGVIVSNFLSSDLLKEVNNASQWPYLRNQIHSVDWQKLTCL